MAAPEPPKSRTCCMLSSGLLDNDPDSLTSNIVDPSKLGHHKQSPPGASGGGKNGIMYTKKLGFLDLSHMRDLCDLTKHVYDRLMDGCPGAASRKAAGTPGTCTINTSTKIRTTHGFAEIKAPLDDAELVQVAQSIAYDDSIGYEIKTYWDTSDVADIGGHNSSFSPEDLPSNYQGTRVGAEAIKRSLANKSQFDDEVDAVLKELCKIAGAEPEDVTQQMIQKYVKGKWVSKTLTIVSDRYLLRRNFTGAYWDVKIDDDGSTLDPASTKTGAGGDLAAYRSKYNFTFDHRGKRFTRDEYWSAEIPKIREDAKKKYGSKYDSPSDRAPGQPAPEKLDNQGSLAAANLSTATDTTDVFATTANTGESSRQDNALAAFARGPSQSDAVAMNDDQADSIAEQSDADQDTDSSEQSDDTVADNETDEGDDSDSSQEIADNEEAADDESEDSEEVAAEEETSEMEAV